ncbi:MAG TPA: hypothetical protein VL966_13170 [Alphaproteobacteria bacterium]|jgi:hypothetical protein|nr:hypothetical protein [Alphaproteobacteria bacterium]
MNARPAALLLILTASGMIAGCSLNPFGGSERAEPTQATMQTPGEAPTNAVPASATNSSTSDPYSRGVWPTTPVPPVTGKEIDDGSQKKSCTTAQRLRYDC